MSRTKSQWLFGKVLMGALVLGVLGTVASAQSHRSCAPRDIIVGRLETKYGETRKSIGLGTNNAMVEVFASDESGSWTITITTPAGVTCLMATGLAYEATFQSTEFLGDDT